VLADLNTYREGNDFDDRYNLEKRMTTSGRGRRFSNVLAIGLHQVLQFFFL
jgi:hypothetical protein